MSKIPPKLYHYCSIESFYKIINSQSIWLSNSSQLNDSKESVWIERYFDSIEEKFSEKKYGNIFEIALQVYEWNKRPPFVFCFSRKKDSLSQWRAYSDDGHGVAIGFSTKILNLSQDFPVRNVSADRSISLNEVEYRFDNQKKIVTNICERFIELYENTEYSSNVGYFLGTILVKYSLIFKNKSFAAESEWRIIHTPSTEDYSIPSDTEKILSKRSFVLKGNKIVSYYDYSLKDKFKTDLIKEIVLGPKCEMTEIEIYDFLKANNLKDTKISISKSTYR